MNVQVDATPPSPEIRHRYRKSRWLIGIGLLLFTAIALIGLALALLASLKPCFFIRCHPRASKCVNRSPFKGQCLCNAHTAGNGRTVCDECGITPAQLNARIMGGIDAPAHSWPFAVLIRQRYRRMVTLNGKTFLISTSWMCGGTLINHRTVLTAAHCLKTIGDTFEYRTYVFPIVWNDYYSNIESTLEVSVGVHDRRNETDRRLVRVVQVILHPAYDDQQLLNDIAVVKLEDYLRPSTSVQFACLPHAQLDFNTTVIVVGFGDTIPGANQGSPVLKQTSLTIYPDGFCSDVSPSIDKNWQTQICCGDLDGQRDTCQGDSGGGLYVQHNSSRVLRYSVDGIVSYGERCGSPMKPGIYTRVSNYLDWIQENSDFDTVTNT